MLLRLQAQKVISKEELRDLQIQRQQERDQRCQQDEMIRQREENLKRQRAIQFKENRIHALEYNALYEYTTVYLTDSRSGILDKNSLDTTLQEHAAQGWRLHSVVSNEVGKNASSTSFGGISMGTNSTIDITILIFERCIKLPGQ